MNIKKQVEFFIKKFGTNNPFEIADSLGIKVMFTQLGKISGYYKYVEHRKCIYINSDIADDVFRKLVMAHELGHAIRHPKENCYFMQNKTLLLTSKTEIEANTFAMELLISDQDLDDCKEYTLDQLSRVFGYHRKLIELRIKNN